MWPIYRNCIADINQSDSVCAILYSVAISHAAGKTSSVQRELEVKTPGVAGKCIASMIGTLDLSLIPTENPFYSILLRG